MFFKKPLFNRPYSALCIGDGTLSSDLKLLTHWRFSIFCYISRGTPSCNSHCKLRLEWLRHWTRTTAGAACKLPENRASFSPRHYSNNNSISRGASTVFFLWLDTVTQNIRWIEPATFVKALDFLCRRFLSFPFSLTPCFVNYPCLFASVLMPFRRLKLICSSMSIVVLLSVSMYQQREYRRGTKWSRQSSHILYRIT